MTSTFPSSTRTKSTRAKPFRGVAILELVIVMPMLLALAFGMVEYGQYFHVRSIFEEACRDAARAAIPSTASKTDPATAATRMLANANVTFNSSMLTFVQTLTGAPITDITTMTPGDGLTVNLQVTYSTIPGVYRPLHSMTGLGINDTKTLSTSVTVVKE